MCVYMYICSKRRFQEDGFDLDLAYVTDTLIGMSVPAVGKTSLYRNPIDEVARFFRARHPNGYMIYNCTTECAYPAEPFGGCVSRVPIEDHHVPTLSTIIAFCRDLEERHTANPDITFAVHCRGGKGRTGLMVCSWLLWTRHSTTAESALAYWATRRTDENLKGKLQGVQTMAQVRYVNYIEQLLAIGKPLAPAVRSLTKVVLRNILPDGLDTPETMLPWVVLSTYGPHGRTSLDTAHDLRVRVLGKSGGGARMLYQRGADVVIEFAEGHAVSGDLRVEVFAEKSNGVAHLEAEARVPHAHGASAESLPSARTKSNKRRSLMSKLESTGASSIKAIAEAAHSGLTNGIAGPAGFDGAPPAAGADRTLLLYTWIHTALEPGCASWFVLEAAEIDIGPGMKSLGKRLRQRNIALEFSFAEPEPGAQGAACSCDALGGAPSSAPSLSTSNTPNRSAIERARLAAVKPQSSGKASAKSAPDHD